MPFKSDSFTIIRENSFDVDTTGADLIYFSLLSFEQGPIMARKVRVFVSLEQYPDQKISFPMDLEFRQCYAKYFAGGTIEKQRIQTGELSYEISLDFKQDPC